LEGPATRTRASLLLLFHFIGAVKRSKTTGSGLVLRIEA